MWMTALIIGALIGLLVKWYFDRIQKQKWFKRIGIPSPEPNIIYGNMMQFNKNGMRIQLLDWNKRYGKTYGYYEGAKPVLATADLDLVKQICIKEFSDFHSRKKSILAGAQDKSILRSEGDDWKRQRMVLSPTFSTRGIKDMSHMVNGVVSKLMELLEKRVEEGKSFDICKDFQKLTISAIACCGFGLDVDAIANPDDIFLQKCSDVFNMRPRSGLFKLAHMASFVCPYAISVYNAISPSQFMASKVWFHDTAKAIIEARRGQKQGNRKDFIDLMLRAEEDPEDQPQDLASLEAKANDDDDGEDSKKSQDKAGKESGSSSSSSAARKKLTISMEEMQASCMSFLLAGFETTSTALGYIAYNLAMHPQVQEKLREEVDEHYPSADSLPDYLSVQKLAYMDMVFHETMRLFPPAQLVQNRTCFKDCTVNGLKFKVGDTVQILVDVIHRDPQHWGPEDTDEFVPERFSPERKRERDSSAWMPFGIGPRNCIGMRFAIMEVKLTLARLLMRFSIERAEETEVPIKVDARGLARPTNGVTIKLVKRP